MEVQPEIVYMAEPFHCARYNTTMLHYSLAVINVTSNTAIGVIIIYVKYVFFASFLFFVCLLTLLFKLDGIL